MTPLKLLSFTKKLFNRDFAEKLFLKRMKLLLKNNHEDIPKIYYKKKKNAAKPNLCNIISLQSYQ